MYPKQKFQKRMLIPIGLLIFGGYKLLEALTTPDTTPDMAEATKVIKQAVWANGFELIDELTEIGVWPDSTADRSISAALFADLHYNVGATVKYIAVDDIYRRRVVAGVSEARSEFALRVPKGRIIETFTTIKCEMYVRRGIAPLFNKPVFMDCDQNNPDFTSNIDSKDYIFVDVFKRDELKSGGLYFGKDIKTRFPNAKTTVDLLKDAAVGNNGKYAWEHLE